MTTNKVFLRLLIIENNNEQEENCVTHHHDLQLRQALFVSKSVDGMPHNCRLPRWTQLALGWPCRSAVGEPYRSLHTTSSPWCKQASVQEPVSKTTLGPRRPLVFVPIWINLPGSAWRNIALAFVPASSTFSNSHKTCLCIVFTYDLSIRNKFNTNLFNQVSKM